MLSIVIPTYNYDCSPLVKQLHKELKHLTLPYEIRVLDDCSGNTEVRNANKSISGLPHCYFSQNETNLGRTATRQALAETAKYNWLLFMDVDVLPQNENFIQGFEIESQRADIVFGGIAYEQSKPDKDKILRWKYGKSREAKPVSERKKMPYLSIISQCFLIRKNIFLKVNDFHKNVYGVDVLFAQNLEQMQVNVKHIDNPVVHLGLESSSSFIEKTERGLETLCQFEKEGRVPSDYRPIQKACRRLRKLGALGLFCRLMKGFRKPIYKNLTSSNPSLFLFDLYRLAYYAKQITIRENEEK